MKALLVIADNSTASLASFYLRPLGLDIIKYQDPLKALDNLEEIMPDALVVSARDFPRHWKILLTRLRYYRSKSDCIAIILKGPWFSLEEAAKASYLGANAVIQEEFSNPVELGRFQDVIKHYLAVDEPRISDRHRPGEWDRLDFVFSHPQKLSLISGTIDTISTSGLSFKADLPALINDIETGTIIEHASLRVDDDIFAWNVKLVRNGSIMAFSFQDVHPEEQNILNRYLKKRAEREMRGLLKSSI